MGTQRSQTSSTEAGSKRLNAAALASLRRRAKRATQILASSYGSPSHDNKADPLDELIFILLSQMTTHHSFRRVYDRLKQTHPTWQELRRIPIGRLKVLIADAGLRNLKAPRIKAVLNRINEDFGRTDLSTLQSMPDEQVEAYLTSLPGVGVKTAKCVMMYSLQRPVLPVDTHVERIARRLNLVSKDVRGPRLHKALEEVVPRASRYAFHVNAIAHGRALCLPRRPRCAQCPLRRLCPSSRQTLP